MKKLLLTIAALTLPLFAIAEDYTVKEVRTAIQHLVPRLEASRATQYAKAILAAHKKYDVEPATLVAIAAQESSFREKLPEGAAGERGICQIRKNWLSNSQFLAEFGKRSVQSLEDPKQAFQFAAWILGGLKQEVAMGTLPYWSYYNARRFEPRLRYFVSVNKKLVRIRRLGFGKPKLPMASNRLPASSENKSARESFKNRPLPAPYNAPREASLAGPFLSIRAD